MRSRHALATSLFLIGLVINPAYFVGCAGEDELEFNYGEEEMLGLLDEVNEAESWFVETDDAEYSLKVSLKQAQVEEARALPATGGGAWAQTAHACGNKTRMFGATASACDTLYQTNLPVEGTLSVFRDEDGENVLIAELDVIGSLDVDSHLFERGGLRLGLAGDNASLEMMGTTAEGFEWGNIEALNLGEDLVDLTGSVKP